MLSRFTISNTDEPVVVNGKDDGVVVLVQNRDVFTFTKEGRLLYASQNGILVKRGLDNRLLLLNERPHVFPSNVSTPLLERAYSMMRTVFDSAPAEAKESLSAVRRCSPSRLANEGDRFEAIFGRVAVLPPDQYRAIYLQPTTGCPHNRCSFCTLHRDRSFRIRSMTEFENHIRAVMELMGRDVESRRTIFLGDANALTVPTRRLSGMMKLASAMLPDRAFYSFIDARLHRSKSATGLRRLRDLGLRRVTLGLETAHPPLYRILEKPGTLADAVATIQLVKEAGLQLGLTILIGVGGASHVERHRKDTVAFLRSLPLEGGDLIYLSPLQDTANQHDRMEEFRESLASYAKERGVKVAKYDLSRFVY